MQHLPKGSFDMKINIYYGGRGIIDDPTLYVLRRMTKVFHELNVKVEQFNLFEQKNSITALAGTIKDADGILLASTVEWYGVGGFMTQFLDACWLYGDKQKIATLYMLPVVMSTTYGERDGLTRLSTAWEILGGLPCEGVCGFIADTKSLEENTAYNDLIEKKAENFYRSINQKLPGLPNSNAAVKTRISLTKAPDLTPQESEQLSKYASDDLFVQTQKEDIQELTDLFRARLGNETLPDDKPEDYLAKFRAAYTPADGIKALYRITVTDKPALGTLELAPSGNGCICTSEVSSIPGDVIISLEKSVLDDIVSGRMTFQRAFMSGSIKMKGEFNLLRVMDQIFPFKGKE